MQNGRACPGHFRRIVGWVERSETHHHMHRACCDGFRSGAVAPALYPSYGSGVSSFDGRAFVVVEAVEHRRLMRQRCLQHRLHARTSFCREMQRHAAAIIRRALALEKLVTFHPVQRLGQPRLLHQRHGGEFADREALDIGEAGQHAPFRHREVPLLQPRVKLAGDVEASARQQIGQVVARKTVAGEGRRLPLSLVNAAHLAGVKHQGIVNAFDEVHDFTDENGVIAAGITRPCLAFEDRCEPIDQRRAGNARAVIDIGKFIGATTTETHREFAMICAEKVDRKGFRFHEWIVAR